MASSTSNIDQLSQAQAGKEVTINALLDAASPATLYGRRQSACSGLTWGYYGGVVMLGSTATQIANGTLTLAASATNYIQANPATGAVSSNTTGFTAGYWQMYVVVTGTATATSYTDNRILGQSLTGFSNPMSAVGDMIIGGTAGAGLRLAAATNGMILTLVSGSPAWAAATAYSLPNASATVLGGVKVGSGLAIDGAGVLSASASAPSTSALTDFANAAGTTTGLTYGYNAGVIRSDNATASVAAGTVLLAASVTNYVEVTGAGVVSANATGFTSGKFPLCTVLTGASTITTITDKRGFASVGGGTGGLLYSVEARSIAAPNATVPVHSLAATGTEANIDYAHVPKGTGAFATSISDGTATGGQKRGANAVDLQMVRTNAAQAAVGVQAVIGGGTKNTASGAQSVVSGGDSNTAAGLDSTVGGGTLNYASTSSCTIGGGISNGARGQNSTVGGGSTNVANLSNGSNGTIGGGANNTADGNNVTIGGGSSNIVSAASATVAGGASNTANGIASFIPGGQQATTRAIQGMEAISAGQFAAQGDAQRGRYIFRRATTDATASIVTADAAAAGSSNQAVMPSGSTYGFSGRIAARNAANGDSSHWKFEGTIKNIAGTVSLVGTVTPGLISQDTGASAWTVTVTADNTNKCLSITVTGVAATNIKWVATVETIEIVG